MIIATRRTAVLGLVLLSILVCVDGAYSEAIKHTSPSQSVFGDYSTNLHSNLVTHIGTTTNNNIVVIVNAGPNGIMSADLAWGGMGLMPSDSIDISVDGGGVISLGANTKLSETLSNGSVFWLFYAEIGDHLVGETELVTIQISGVDPQTQWAGVFSIAQDTVVHQVAYNQIKTIHGQNEFLIPAPDNSLASGVQCVSFYGSANPSWLLVSVVMTKDFVGVPDNARVYVLADKGDLPTQNLWQTGSDVAIFSSSKPSGDNVVVINAEFLLDSGDNYVCIQSASSLQEGSAMSMTSVLVEVSSEYPLSFDTFLPMVTR